MRISAGAAAARHPVLARVLVAPVLVAAVLVAAAPATAAEQSRPDAWPGRAVTVVPFGAGSGTDIATRIVAEPLGAAPERRR